MLSELGETHEILGRSFEELGNSSGSSIILDGKKQFGVVFGDGSDDLAG